MKKLIVLLILPLLGYNIIFAQENMNMPGMKGMDMDTAMKKHKPMDMSSMCSALSLNLPMEQNGSGTSWLPDASPMNGYMVHSGKWMFMFHGNLFIRYNRQDLFNAGSRGGDKWDAPDFLMAMAQRKIGRHGLLSFSGMFSLDALTMGGHGYPLLFQTGESWKGQPLVDRQHPHDLFSELAVSYAYALSKKSDLYAYIGYPGEPALGPVVFMHRSSAFYDPDAPIGHHWEDATHITFGVATIGYRYNKFKIEASSFKGREPDENRYNFDMPKFDSWSGRLSYNPSEHWAIQVSHGYIKSPEALRPDENVNRSTASVIYSYPFGEKNYFDATALWGLNKTPGQDGSNAALLEANVRLKKLDVYMRYEWVQKSGEELNLNESIYGAYIMYPINAITLGAGYDLFSIGHITVAGGGQLSLYHADPIFDGLYGQNPMAAEVYLHIYPRLMN